MFVSISAFNVLNTFFLTIYFTIMCKPKQTACPVRRVGESIRVQIPESEMMSTRTAKPLPQNDKEDRSTRVSRRSKRELKREEKSKSMSKKAVKEEKKLEMSTQLEGKSSKSTPKLDANINCNKSVQKTQGHTGDESTKGGKSTKANKSAEAVAKNTTLATPTKNVAKKDSKPSLSAGNRSTDAY